MSENLKLKIKNKKLRTKIKKVITTKLKNLT